MSSTSSSVLTLSSFNLLFFTQGKHLTLYITPIPIGINERPSLDACPVRVVSVTQFGSNGTRPAGPAGTRLFSGLPVFFLRRVCSFLSPDIFIFISISRFRLGCHQGVINCADSQGLVRENFDKLPGLT